MADYLLIIRMSVTLLQDSSNTPVAFKSIKKARATIPYQQWLFPCFDNIA